VLERARANRVTGQRFRALYDRRDVPYRNPDTGFPDHSRAHFELLRMLAFWTGRNAKQMEHLFSESAHGQHEKWTERPDYRTRTIRAAIKRTRKTYQLGRPKPNATALEKLWVMDQVAAHAPWTGKNGPRNRYALDAMISTGVEQGKDYPAGVTLQASVGYLALRAGISSSRRMQAAIEDLEREGWITVLERSRDGETPNTYLLRRPAQVDPSYHPCVNTIIKLRALLIRIRDNGRPTGGGEFVAKGRDGSRIVSYAVQVPPRPPIVHGSIGKAGALCIEKVLLAGGRMDRRELSATMNRERPRDYIRRVIDPTVAAGLLVSDGDGVRVPEDLEKRLRDHLLDSGALRAEYNQAGHLYSHTGKDDSCAGTEPEKEHAA
jgi:hypothetical protein